MPVVKAYPVLSKTYGEVSCIAGVTLRDGKHPEWIRLYPVPFRALGDSQRFAKYQPIRVEVEQHSKDRRPETRRPNRDSITLAGEPISPQDAWRDRRRFIEPLMAESMCAIQRRQAEDGTSLGIFRPKEVLGLKIEKANVSVEKQRHAKAWAAQSSLLDELGPDEKQHQLRELELIPWSFKFQYTCSDPACGKQHTQSIIDWEIAETYRRVRDYDDWKDRLRQRWIGDLCAPDRDTAFIVGNQHQHPVSFLVLGVWWPERRLEQLALTDISDG